MLNMKSVIRLNCYVWRSLPANWSMKMVNERFFKWIPYFEKRLWRSTLTLGHEEHRTTRCILTRACHGRHLNIG